MHMHGDFGVIYLPMYLYNVCLTEINIIYDIFERLDNPIKLIQIETSTLLYQDVYTLLPFQIWKRSKHLHS